MSEITVGSRIEHKLLPGFHMTVLEVQPCDGDERAEPHPAYRIIDPEGAEDWLCSRDVRLLV